MDEIGVLDSSNEVLKSIKKIEILYDNTLVIQNETDIWRRYNFSFYSMTGSDKMSKMKPILMQRGFNNTLYYVAERKDSS